MTVFVIMSIAAYLVVGWIFVIGMVDRGEIDIDEESVFSLLVCNLVWVLIFVGVLILVLKDYLGGTNFSDKIKSMYDFRHLG